MKKLKYLYFALAGIFFTYSCTDDDKLNQNFPLNELTNGAFIRTVLPFVSNSINFFELEDGRFEAVIEVNDGGVDFTEVEVLVRYVDNLTEEEENSTEEFSLKTFTPSDFTIHESSGLPRRNLVVTIDEFLSVLPLDFEDVEGGNAFTVRLILRLSDGRSFTNSNTGVDVRALGGAFASPFFYTVPLVCPSALAGESDNDDPPSEVFDYIHEVSASPWGPDCDGLTLDGTVTITADEETFGVYHLSDGTFGLWDCFGDNWSEDDSDLTFNDACGVLSYSGTDKYGASYELTFVSNDGQNLVFDWENSDGEAGRVTIIAPEPDWWPLDLQ